MPRFELHPEAARALDERGNELLSKVVSVTRQQEHRPFASQRVPAMVITEADIVGRMTMQRVDEFRREVTAVHFEGPGPVGVVGLEGEAVKELDKLAQLAQKYLRASTSVSLRFLRDTLIDWIQEKFRGEVAESLSDFLLPRLTDAVALRTILIPIANLCLEEDLPFGPVEFKVITAEMVDSWYDAFRMTCSPADTVHSTSASIVSGRKRRDWLPCPSLLRRTRSMPANSALRRRSRPSPSSVSYIL